MKVELKSNAIINISAISILLDKKEYYIQWSKLIPSEDPEAPEGTLVPEPGVNETVEIIAFDTAFDTLTSKSFATMKNTIANFLINKYKDTQ